ncbi:30S ribosomal protein S18 [Candidatus Mycoplasma haematominutum]|uniref:Small ribosomal subunit protein bS18 n=1 Tax=Candidatus Mycoplasma haematominutum 'Birmingham 1' TaxID=1116213 RepID=G8C2I7_9MOLU|nr:30S ribosomal protein S18 [Candidatus Mycoplasma haematominutum]CCE66535.1 ribosomal protein S18 [Candidatus Mycoplasma haematominutum 'Birmingham 1']
MEFSSEELKESGDSTHSNEGENLAQSTPTETKGESPLPARSSRGNFERKRKNRYKKNCWLCRQGKLLIDYKEAELLKNYLRRYNKILIHKVSGNCLKHQHQLAQAIKRARFIALLPFVPE